MDLETRVRRFSVEEYHRMGEAGIFHEDDRVELIEGRIVEMSPIGSPHGGCVKRLIHLLSRIAGDRAIVSAQDPIILSHYTEPQPDIVLLRARADFYSRSHPRPQDALLVIEVADTTLAYDRGIKMRLYAESGVPGVWVVDLNGEEILIGRDPDPSSGRYRIRETRRRGERLEVPGLPDARLTVDDVLGDRV